VSKQVVAVCGKGGVGKTTVAAVIAQALFQRPERKVLLVDADPAGGLSTALAIPVKRTLDQVRQETTAEIKKRETDAQDLAMSLDYRLLEALVERGNLALLALGRPESVGCYCSVNTLLREALELLAGRFDLVVIDAEAGIEQVNRRVLSAVDRLLLVSDTSLKGLRVAETICQVAQKISGLATASLLLNRVRGPEELIQLQARTALEIVGWIPEDETIRQFDAQGRSFLELPDSPAARAIVQALAAAGIIR
jgi:CO dehydrogenase maturation factor